MENNKFTERYRHELKYFISYISTWEYQSLAKIFADTMQVDPNCNENGEYWIRSLYFDTLENDDLYEKVCGNYRRKKIRLRIYAEDQQDAKIEIKNRIEQYVFKESATLSRPDALELIAGNKEVLLKYNDSTLNNVYYYMAQDLYRPAVIVDYDREAFIGPSDDIRITFDKNIRGSSINFDLYNKHITTLQAFDEETVVLEVKFKEFLPDWIREILKFRQAERFAISKYYFTRILHYR